MRVRSLASVKIQMTLKTLVKRSQKLHEMFKNVLRPISEAAESSLEVGELDLGKLSFKTSQELRMLSSVTINCQIIIPSQMEV